jgi:hypothetical protein
MRAELPIILPASVLIFPTALRKVRKENLSPQSSATTQTDNVTPDIIIMIMRVALRVCIEMLFLGVDDHVHPPYTIEVLFASYQIEKQTTKVCFVVAIRFYLWSFLFPLSGQ